MATIIPRRARPAYYNEINPHAAQWLRNLIKAGHIAPGDVDTRSILDVCPADLAPYRQCHFFAGIGIWSLALRRAGWPDDEPVWSASAPCQPLSTAGRRLGFADERHLWPAVQWLAQERRPQCIVGEQVASVDADPWIDLVQDDLEGMGYRVGSIAFPAASIGAPMLRDRLYWVADTDLPRLEGRRKPASQRALKRSPWARGVAVRGSDGRRRLIEPGVFPLAHGHPSRVGRLHAYGNAINAQQAAVFIDSYLSTGAIA